MNDIKLGICQDKNGEKARNLSVPKQGKTQEFVRTNRGNSQEFVKTKIRKQQGMT